MTHRRDGRPRTLRIAAALVLAVVAAACGDGADEASDEPTGDAAATRPTELVPAPVQTLEVLAGDYTFELSPGEADALSAGWTEVTLRNVGAEAHQIMFAQLKDGVDMAALAAAGAGDSSGSGAIEFVDMLGGVSYIAPGKEVTAMVDLPEGAVLAMCYVPDAHGVAHALLGMTTTLAVGPAPDVAPEPTSGREEVQGTILMADDGYQLPDRLPAGWYHVRNTDDDDPSSGLHELSLLRLGRSVGDDEVSTVVAELAANEVPDVGVEGMGGLGAISPGFDGYLYLDLAPGPYLAVDFMPDPRDPRPHMLDGYHATFEP